MPLNARAPLLRSAAALLLVLKLAGVAAQEPPGTERADFRLSLGVANAVVAEAWNPLRLELRDAPPATLTLFIDQGTLATGEIPLELSYGVRGGAGVSVFEELLYVPNFRRLTWRLSTGEAVLASGSLPAREADRRPLDLLLTSAPGAYLGAPANALGSDARLVDVSAADLPSEPAAYDGVRSLLIDGSTAAPRLEAVAAAAAGGAQVVLLCPLPRSYDELTLLHGQKSARLGAGTIHYSEEEPTGTLMAVRRSQPAASRALLAALLDEPLVEPAPPLKQSRLFLLVAAYSLAALLLMNLAGAPGLLAAAALALSVSLAAWGALRPASSEVAGGVTLAVIGGELALAYEAREVLSLPHTTLTLPQHARPFRPQAYSVDAAGAHLPIDRWRVALLEFAPRVVAAPLQIEGGLPRNSGERTLHHVAQVGGGRYGSLPPGAAANVGAAVSGAPTGNEREAPPGFDLLLELLPEGSWVASSGCPGACSVWVAEPPLLPGEEAGAAPRAPEGQGEQP